MSQRKDYIIETTDRQGKLIERITKNIENNPAYGEVECKLILSNNPHIHAVTILEQLPGFMVDENGDHRLDGEGNRRPLLAERMIYARHVNGQTFELVREDWQVLN